MRTLLSVFALTAVGLTGLPAIAADCAGEPTRCAQCGRYAACVEKTCQVVCEMKKETKTYWCVECKEMCPLMPGCHGCCGCPPPPRCGHPKCVKKLIKKEYQIEVPVYKCVVQYLCPECAEGAPSSPPTAYPTVAPPAGTRLPPVPPPPPVPSRVPR